MRLPDTIDVAIRNYRDAVGRHVRRDIDAATCGTRRDWERAEEADEQELAAEEALRVAIVRALKETPCE